MVDAKEFLRHPNRILRDIEILREKAEALRTNILKAVSYDKEKVQTPTGDIMAEYVAKVADIDDKILALTEEYNDALDEVEDAVYKIESEDARTILTKRYIGRKPWRRIEDETNMAETTVFRYHQIGIRAITKILHETQSRE